LIERGRGFGQQFIVFRRTEGFEGVSGFKIPQ